MDVRSDYTAPVAVTASLRQWAAINAVNSGATASAKGTPPGAAVIVA